MVGKADRSKSRARRTDAQANPETFFSQSLHRAADKMWLDVQEVHENKNWMKMQELVQEQTSHLSRSSSSAATGENLTATPTAEQYRGADLVTWCQACVRLFVAREAAKLLSRSFCALPSQERPRGTGTVETGATNGEKTSATYASAEAYLDEAGRLDVLREKSEYDAGLSTLPSDETFSASLAVKELVELAGGVLALWGTNGNIGEEFAYRDVQHQYSTFSEVVAPDRHSSRALSSPTKRTDKNVDIEKPDEERGHSEKDECALMMHDVRGSVPSADSLESDLRHVAAAAAEAASCSTVFECRLRSALLAVCCDH
ncbi:unnamed protein product [Amoebophrya sp. A25]|nr:unnamed protein product [Amoebophrya sp. A25]|eukprot:GSA25T00021569001.1